MSFVDHLLPAVDPLNQSNYCCLNFHPKYPVNYYYSDTVSCCKDHCCRSLCCFNSVVVESYSIMNIRNCFQKHSYFLNCCISSCFICVHCSLLDCYCCFRNCHRQAFYREQQRQLKQSSCYFYLKDFDSANQLD